MPKNILNNAATKIVEAQTKPDEMEIEDLTDTKSQLSEVEKSLHQFTRDTDSLSPDLEDADDDKQNDAISYYFNQNKDQNNSRPFAQLRTERRRNLARENKEREI